MAHIPQGDVEELWKSTPQHSWKALHQNLEGRKGKTEGISNYVVDDLIRITDNLENSGTAYPSSAQQLGDVLNQKMQVH